MNMDYIPEMNISEFTIKNREIENINVEYLTLSKAKFENVTFFNTFVKGVFFQCEFINCKFLNAFEDGVQRYDCLYVNCTFINCGKPEPYEFYNCKIINENRIEIDGVCLSIFLFQILFLFAYIKLCLKNLRKKRM